jgi:hypothetical protein
MKISTLTILHKKLIKLGIKHIFREHPGYREVKRAIKELKKVKPQTIITENLTGKHQILLENESHKLSIIRGYASMGYYEVYDGNECERFDNIKEVIEKIKKYYPTFYNHEKL